MQGTGSSAHRAAYRAAMGEFVTGVTVVTAERGGIPAGMTVNAFCSVSLEPLLLLVALTEGSRTLAAVAKSGKFAVNLLSRAQQPVAMAFAKKGAPFPTGHALRDAQSFWTVPGAVATFRCQLARLIPAGDHHLVLGEVAAFSKKGGDPLIFHRGTLGGLNQRPEERTVFEGAAW